MAQVFGFLPTHIKDSDEALGFGLPSLGCCEKIGLNQFVEDLSVSASLA